MTPPQHHLQVDAGEVGGYVLLPGDPGRCETIAGYLDGAREVARHREFTTFTGSLDGVPVSVTSTGIGGASASIAAEELIRVGCHTLLRVGTCGAMAAEVGVGDLVIVQAAVRQEGTSQAYVPQAFPAVAHLDVVWALRQAAAEADHRFKVGIAVSTDGFYPDIEPSTSPLEGLVSARRETWTRAGCIAAEMEAAALFVVASIRRVRAGAILVVIDEVGAGVAAMPDPHSLRLAAGIETAIAAIRGLIALDREVPRPRDAGR